MRKTFSGGTPSRPPTPPPPPPGSLPGRSAGERPAGRLPASQRRADILGTAFPLFARQGYAATTTRELAAAAGVTEPILYRHFPSKEALFEAVFDGAEDRILASLAEAAGETRGAERIEAISKGLDGILERNRDEFRLVNGTAATNGDAATVRRVRAIYVRIGDFLTAAAAGAGLRRGVSAETAGYLLLEVGLGAALVHPIGVPVVEADGFRAKVMKVLVAGLIG
jgi:AcrR family transcriptional regulator